MIEEEDVEEEIEEELVEDSLDEIFWEEADSLDVVVVEVDVGSEDEEIGLDELG